MNMRAVIFVAIAMMASLTGPAAAELPTMTVWKSPLCGCCGKWVEHMQAAGFKVVTKEVKALDTVKRLAGVPEALQACHTAEVGGYTVEGHVPAADVKRLLATKPNVRGLAVPGMPSGSPGMENGEREAYDVLTFARDGRTEVFASHK
ncbi:MAG: DUF411 domain-containing protein [Methyloligellaceae bacterium]